jgi:TPR repeat protein
MHAARSGKPAAELALGRSYLFGEATLKKNLMSSLYWLHRAASHHEADAWMLIGAHIPYATVAEAPEPMHFCTWYDRALRAGVLSAAVVLAKLLLNSGNADVALRTRALTALQEAAAGGILEAQWLLAQELKKCGDEALPDRPAGLAREAHAMPGMPKRAEQVALEWAARAAESGVLPAQHALAERAWRARDGDAFLRWSLPAARALIAPCSRPPGKGMAFEEELTLAYRCARCLIEAGNGNAHEVESLLLFSAQGGHVHAQYSLGTWYANLDEEAQAVHGSGRRSKYRQAVKWLTMACERGDPRAWYAMFRVYTKPNSGLCDHSAAQAGRWLERAAELGHARAQFMLGAIAWRKRRSRESNDVCAAYWLQKASAQGNREADALLRQVADAAMPAAWAQAAQQRLTPEAGRKHPLLAARVELAARFGLVRHEALLVDLNTADRGHCLIIDVRAQYAHSRRRLILVNTGAERLALNRIVSQFSGVECGPGGPEGNYRRRLYLLANFIAPASPAIEA